MKEEQEEKSGYFPATADDVKKGEVYRKAVTDIGNYIVRRLGPGIYEIVSKPVPSAAS